MDYLRRECSGMRIIHEGRAFIKDNPVVSVLLSLVQFAAHPGDTFAWRHLQMSPLQSYLISQALDRNSLPLVLLRKLQADGFQSLIREWGARLDAAHPLDDFGRKRLGELTNAAIEFDQTGSRDCNSFLRFIDSYEIHDLAASEAVRVMTIHQSKGLGFDIVVLPDLQSGNMAGEGQPGFVMARNPETEEPVRDLVLAESPDEIEVPRPPAQAVFRIQYYDTANALQTLPTTEWDTYRCGEYTRVILENGSSWPSTISRPDAVIVTYESGYSDTSNGIPKKAKQAILMVARHWYDNPAAVVTGTITSPVELTVDSLVRSLHPGTYL